MLAKFITWFSGETLPPGDATYRFLSEGIGFGWGVTVLLLGAALVWWTYRGTRQSLTPLRRHALTLLRWASLLLLIVLLVQPVALLHIEEKVRSTLLVLIDDSQSMTIADHRSDPADRQRAAALVGAEKAAADPKRLELARAIFSSKQDGVWQKIAATADVKMARFGENYAALGGADEALARPDLEKMAGALKFDQTRTGLGTAVKEALGEWRGVPLAGVLVLTDGASNSGLPTPEAAAMAEAEEVPLFLLGFGVSSPVDLRILDLDVPNIALVKESVQARVTLRVSGLPPGTRTKVTTRLDGKVVNEQEVELQGTPEQEVLIEMKPEEEGLKALEVEAAPVAGEGEKDNNIAKSQLRVVDEKVQLLYIEQKARWDFRYIVNALKDDRRVDLKAFVVQGELMKEPEGEDTFLDALPKNAAEILRYQVVILGDVDPRALGPERLDALRRLVEETGGGLIFLAGPHFNPDAYRGTPLEALLPVDLGAPAPDAAERFPEPRTLELTDAGRESPLLQLSEKPEKNEALWRGFKGVRWVARSAREKPTAATLLVLPPETPVIARQTYGQGQTLYFGTDETYRWRSGHGGEFFNRIWTQIIQNFALERMASASATTQLRTDRTLYFVGDEVRIYGKVFDENFQPLSDAAIEGEIALAEGGPAEPISLEAVPDSPGTYQGKWIARAPGSYRFVPLREREAALNFEVQARNAELLNPALEIEPLQAMAATSRGRFLREDELGLLPDLIKASQASIPREKTVALYHALPLLIAFIVLLCLEWMLRRIWQLK